MNERHTPMKRLNRSLIGFGTKSHARRSLSWAYGRHPRGGHAARFRTIQIWLNDPPVTLWQAGPRMVVTARREFTFQAVFANWAVCELSHTHARTFALHPPLTDAPDARGCHMQPRIDESRAHGWPWAPDVTRALLCLMVGLLLVFASVTVPA
jgi:hypothetical protein